MSFENQETSVESAAPIELFLIEGQDTFYYTSAPVPYEYDGDTYEPIAISRTAPVVSTKDSAGEIQITFPFNNDFVLRYLSGTPPAPDQVTIFQVHLSDSTEEVVPFWAGPVSGVKFSGNDAKVNVSGILARTAKQIPDQTFSWTCNHVLYGSRCGVIEGDFTYSFTVTSVDADGVQISVTDRDPNNSPASVLAADSTFFQGGTFRDGSEGSQRMLLSMTETTPNNYDLVLIVPVEGLSVGDAVSISAGCNRAVQTCYYRFDNIENYGGFTFVPSLNPFSTDVKREE